MQKKSSSPRFFRAIGIILACSVVIFTKHFCFLVFYKNICLKLRKMKFEASFFQTKLLSPLSHKVRRLLCSPLLLRKFTNTIVNLRFYAARRERKEDGKSCVTSVTIILFQTIFRQTSLSFRQIFL